MVPKIIALYLPQFHNIKENNEWYGEGFTDWVAVREAKPLFEGHMQPRKPLNNNYYDLSNVEAIKWQAEQARKYGIDGFCFYHYWFDSEKRLMEKPAELLLSHKEIDITFCFSWANESWKRTWNNISKGNVWCDKYDNDSKKKFNDKGLLVKQRYGREQEWEKHINYFIPFFKDKRYLRIEGKPVLCLYHPCDIPCMKAMLELWNRRLEEEDIKGVYLIGASYGNDYSKYVDISYNHEPGTAYQKCREAKRYVKNKEGTEFFDYDTIWETILDEVTRGRVSCALTGFDASPRKGYKSTIVRGNTPEKFERYFKRFLKKNIQTQNELVLINAWNEWGEGMYLEPCEDNGYGYLKAVQSAVLEVSGDDKLYISQRKTKDSAVDYVASADVKQLRRVQVSILSEWLYAYRSGIRVSDYFEKYGYFSVAIYGMGILGLQLKEELKESELELSYYIDRVDKVMENDLKRVSIEDKLPEVDCIVVTVITEFETIYNILKEKSSASIINIMEICEDLF